jgi:hypothetical protein
MASVADLSLQYSDYGEERAKPPQEFGFPLVLRVSPSSALLEGAEAEVAASELEHGVVAAHARNVRSQGAERRKIGRMRGRRRGWRESIRG